ncbi:MAG: hypothetical protein U9Q69_00335 [Nanoarchaeota archaeon]|nr:hypothetical protein [Nanoarchaeota archaeon]
MKKGFWIFGLILALPLVYAQEIMIGEKTYPLIILIPLLIVVGIWLIILLIYFKNNFHKFSLILFNFRKFLQKAGLWKLPQFIKEIKKQEEEKPKEEKKEEEEVKKDLTLHVDKISKFENNLPKLKDKEAFKTFNSISKDFFSDLLGMNYEFTDQELIDELQKKRKSLVNFASKLAHLKYSGHEISKKEIIALLDEFKDIVKTHAKKSHKQKSITPKSLKEKLIEQDKKIFENIKDYIKFLKKENRRQQIQDLLDEERVILKENIRTIKRTYNKILDYYVQLSPRDRAKIYPELMEFYHNINKAIFSSIYGERSKKELEYFKNELERIKNKPKKFTFALKIKHFLETMMPEKSKIKLTGLEPLKKQQPIEKPAAMVPQTQKIEPSAGVSQQIKKLKAEEQEIINAIRTTVLEDIELKRKQEAQKMEMLKNKRERLAITDFKEQMRAVGKPIQVPAKTKKIIEPEEQDSIKDLSKEQQDIMAKINQLKQAPIKEELKVIKNVSGIIHQPQLEQRKIRMLKEKLYRARRYFEADKLGIAQRFITEIKKEVDKLPQKNKLNLEQDIISIEMDIENKRYSKNLNIKKLSKRHLSPQAKIMNLEDEQKILLQEIENLKENL